MSQNVPTVMPTARMVATTSCATVCAPPFWRLLALLRCGAYVTGNVLFPAPRVAGTGRDVAELRSAKQQKS